MEDSMKFDLQWALILGLVLMFTISCNGDESDESGTPDADADADADADGDADADTDTDTDTDGDTDTDTDGDTDADSDVPLDCLGVPNGTAVTDACGVCNGNGATCDCSADSFCARMVTSHNTVRRSVNDGTFHNQPVPSSPLPDVTWDPELAMVAYNWAQQCRWDHNENRTEDYAARGGPEYVGENIAASGAEGQPSTDQTVISQWSDEAQWYNHATNSCQAGKMCGHYTQVVWKTSVRIGCAVVYCNSWVDNEITWPGWFTVCNYAPGGNYSGQKPY
jgi:uncharacterized protein YkwD